MNSTRRIGPVDVDIEAETPTGYIHLRGAGRSLLLSFESERQFTRMLWGLLRRRPGHRLLKRIPPLLARADIEIAIRIRSATVAHCGAGIPMQVLPRLLGLRHVAIRYGGLLRVGRQLLRAVPLRARV